MDERVVSPAQKVERRVSVGLSGRNELLLSIKVVDFFMFGPLRKCDIAERELALGWTVVVGDVC
jgi:hypothetical protein